MIEFKIAFNFTIVIFSEILNKKGGFAKKFSDLIY